MDGEKIIKIHRALYDEDNPFIIVPRILLEDDRFNHCHIDIMIQICLNKPTFQFRKEGGATSIRTRTQLGTDRFRNAWDNLIEWKYIIQEGKRWNAVFYADLFGRGLKPKNCYVNTQSPKARQLSYRRFSVAMLRDARFKHQHRVLMVALINNADNHKILQKDYKKVYGLGRTTTERAWDDLVKWNYLIKIGERENTVWLLDETGLRKNLILTIYQKQTIAIYQKQTMSTYQKRTDKYKDFNTKRINKEVAPFFEIDVKTRFDDLPDSEIKTILTLKWFPHLINERNKKVDNRRKMDDFVYLCLKSEFNPLFAYHIVDISIVEFNVHGKDGFFCTLDDSEKKQLLIGRY